MLIVYRQAEPIRTTEPMWQSNEVWHRAQLIKVGECETWEQAKGLCVAPIVELVRR